MALERIPEQSPKTVNKTFRVSYGTVEALNRLEQITHRKKAPIIEALILAEMERKTAHLGPLLGAPRPLSRSYKLSAAAAKQLSELSRRHTRPHRPFTEADIVEALVARDLQEQLAADRPKRRA